MYKITNLWKQNFFFFYLDGIEKCFRTIIHSLRKFSDIPPFDIGRFKNNTENRSQIKANRDFLSKLTFLSPFHFRDHNKTTAALGVISEPVSMNWDAQKDPKVGINRTTLHERLSQTIELAIRLEITKSEKAFINTLNFTWKLDRSTLRSASYNLSKGK